MHKRLHANELDIYHCRCTSTVVHNTSLTLVRASNDSNSATDSKPTFLRRSFRDLHWRFRGPLLNDLAHTTLHQSHGRPIFQLDMYHLSSALCFKKPHCPRYDPAITLTGISSVPLNISHFFCVFQGTLTTQSLITRETLITTIARSPTWSHQCAHFQAQIFSVTIRDPLGGHGKKPTRFNDSLRYTSLCFGSSLRLGPLDRYCLDLLALSSLVE
jgi:hypothetical protein